MSPQSQHEIEAAEDFFSVFTYGMMEYALLISAMEYERLHYVFWSAIVVASVEDC